MAMIPIKRILSPEQRRALGLLASAALGYSESILLAHGFTARMLGGLVLGGLATATQEIVQAGKRPIEVVRMRITDTGRRALAE
jgi:hypothetical protein